MSFIHCDSRLLERLKPKRNMKPKLTFSLVPAAASVSSRLQEQLRYTCNWIDTDRYIILYMGRSYVSVPCWGIHLKGSRGHVLRPFRA